jgi:nitrogen-specific signal transduction histidine kinase/ActR/RegA family two-component response regulator
MKEPALRQTSLSFQWDFFERTIANYSIIIKMIEYAQDIGGFFQHIPRVFIEETPFDLCEIVLKDETSVKEGHFALDHSFAQIADQVMDKVAFSTQVLSHAFGYETIYFYPLTANDDRFGCLLLAKRRALDGMDSLKRDLDLLGEILNRCLQLCAHLADMRVREEAKARALDSRLGVTNVVLENVINQFPYPFFLVDQSDHIGFLNRAARNEFREQGILKDQGLDAILPGFREHEGDINGELQFKRGDATKRFSVESYPIRGNKSQWKSVVLKDVTDERCFEEKNCHGGQMDGVARLAGGIAHEFNNLLTGVLGYASLVKRVVSGQSALHRYAEVIEGSAKRGSVITKRLLNLSIKRKNPSGAVDINGLLEDILFLMKGSFFNIEIIKDLDESLPPIRGDEADLQHAFMNLFVNARDAMPERGILHVKTERTTYFAKKECITVKIKDSGCGMDEEVKRRLFEPFFSAKTQTNGLGMGMPIIEKVMRNHGAFMELESEPGKGTCFTIYLPLIRENNEAVEKLVAAGNNWGAKRILLVDDEGVIRELVTTILRQEGFDVFEADNGTRAIEMARKANFDLMILDMVMPGIKGEDVLSAIGDSCRGMQVIVSSGFMSEKQRDRLKEHGIAHFLDKPYREEDVLSEIKKIFSKPSRKTNETKRQVAERATGR